MTDWASAVPQVPPKRSEASVERVGKLSIGKLEKIAIKNDLNSQNMTSTTRTVVNPATQ